MIAGLRCGMSSMDYLDYLQMALQTFLKDITAPSYK